MLYVRVFAGGGWFERQLHICGFRKMFGSSLLRVFPARNSKLGEPTFKEVDDTGVTRKPPKIRVCGVAFKRGMPKILNA